MDENKSLLYIIAIVAVVAIVALVMMISSNKVTSNGADVSGNALKVAALSTKPVAQPILTFYTVKTHPTDGYATFRNSNGIVYVTNHGQFSNIGDTLQLTVNGVTYNVVLTDNSAYPKIKSDFVTLNNVYYIYVKLHATMGRVDLTAPNGQRYSTMEGQFINAGDGLGITINGWNYVVTLVDPSGPSIRITAY